MAASLALERVLVSRYQNYFYNCSRNAHNNRNSSHFGFETVSPEDKVRKVQDVFSSVASRYDQMNDIMSMGVHRLWKDAFVRELHPVQGIKLIDVAGGTGDIAVRVLKFIETYPNELGIPQTKTQSDITVCDFNRDMLKIGQQRSQQMGTDSKISWVHGDATRLPFIDNVFDAYTISFGIRNVVHIDVALQEAYRVLKPGGRFMCLEFSEVRSAPLSQVYDWYSFQILPVIGQIVARDWKSYQYLAESIRKFPNQENFKNLIEEAGFKNVSYASLLCGISAIHSGYKV